MIKVAARRIKNWVVGIWLVPRTAREVTRLGEEIRILQNKLTVVQAVNRAIKDTSYTPTDVAIIFQSVPMLHEKIEHLRQECERLTALYDSIILRTATLEQQVEKNAAKRELRAQG